MDKMYLPQQIEKNLYFTRNMIVIKAMEINNARVILHRNTNWIKMLIFSKSVISVPVKTRSCKKTLLHIYLYFQVCRSDNF